MTGPRSKHAGAVLALGLMACGGPLDFDQAPLDGAIAGDARGELDSRSMTLSPPRREDEPDARAPLSKDPDPTPGSPDAAFSDARFPAVPSVHDGVARRTIMSLGDSTTAGYDGLGTFRFFLWERLGKEGYVFDFVGSQTRNAYRHRDISGPVVIWPDREHEGHEGLRTGEAAQRISGWAQTARPDIALVLVGNNDAGSRSVDEITGNLEKVIDGLRKANSSAAVLLAQLFPGTNGKSRIPAINKGIAELGQRKHTEKNPVIVVDLFNAGYEAKDFCCGGWHLRDSGHKKMADRWYPALITLLAKNSEAPASH